jgi:cytochrome c553
MKKWTGVLALALLSAGALAAQAPDGKDLGWAYPTAAMVVNKPPMPEKEFEGQLTLPNANLTKSFTMAQLENLNAPPDWFPETHAPAPRVVTDGTVNKGFACGSCHLMNGLGHPESGDIQGLTAEYFIQTMKDFKSGKRKDPIRMTAIAQATSDEDSAAAAEWFATLKPPTEKWSKVVEQAIVPKTYLGQGRMRFIDLDAKGATEPIGTRIITLPMDIKRARLRDPRPGAGFTSFVPVGSVARGKALAETGGNGKTVACAICHGEGLNGLGNVPRLSDVHPIYLVRQLYNFQTGANASTDAELMKRVVAKLTDADIVDLAAYAASLPRLAR